MVVKIRHRPLVLEPHSRIFASYCNKSQLIKYLFSTWADKRKLKNAKRVVIWLSGANYKNNKTARRNTVKNLHNFTIAIFSQKFHEINGCSKNWNLIWREIVQVWVNCFFQLCTEQPSKILYGHFECWSRYSAPILVKPFWSHWPNINTLTL